VEPNDSCSVSSYVLSNVGKRTNQECARHYIWRPELDFKPGLELHKRAPYLRDAWPNARQFPRYEQLIAKVPQ